LLTSSNRFQKELAEYYAFHGHRHVLTLLNRFNLVFSIQVDPGSEFDTEAYYLFMMEMQRLNPHWLAAKQFLHASSAWEKLRDEEKEPWYKLQKQAVDKCALLLFVCYESSFLGAKQLGHNMLLRYQG